MAIKMIVMFSIIVSILNTEGLVSAAIISVPPVNAVGCYGGESIFYCGSAEGADIANIGWLINGANVANMDDTVRVARGISVVTSPDNTNTTLTIIGLPVNDGVITCTAVDNSFEFDSETAIFTVSDIPPVEDLSIDLVNNDTVMVVTWSPPSSCIPLYHQYRVTVTNDTNTLMAVSTTDTQYNMTVSQCGDNYTISVSVIDIYYTHNQSTGTSMNGSILTSTAEIAGITSVVDGESPVVIFDSLNASVCIISLKVKLTAKCSDPLLVGSYVATIRQNSQTSRLKILNISYSPSLEKITVGPFVKRFHGTLSVVSAASPDRYISEIPISTFNVQNVTIVQYDEDLEIANIHVTCFFATNSKATGCKVDIDDNSNSSFPETIQRNDSNTAASKANVSIPEGNRMLYVYDIVSGAEDQSVPAFSTILNITYRTAATTYSMSSFSITKSATSSMWLTSTSSTSSILKAITFLMPAASVAATNVPPNQTSNYLAVYVGVVIACLLLVMLVVIILISFFYWRIKWKKKKVRLYRSLDRALVQKPIAEPHCYKELPMSYPLLSLQYSIDEAVSVITQGDSHNQMEWNEQQDSDSVADYFENIPDIAQMLKNKAATTVPNNAPVNNNTNEAIQGSGSARHVYENVPLSTTQTSDTVVQPTGTIYTNLIYLESERPLPRKTEDILQYVTITGSGSARHVSRYENPLVCYSNKC